MDKHWGNVNFDGSLIESIEKPRDLLRQWNMACMSYLFAQYIKNGKLTGAVDYKETKEYKKLYANNNSHEASLRLAAAKKLRAKMEDKQQLA